MLAKPQAPDAGQAENSKALHPEASLQEVNFQEACFWKQRVSVFHLPAAVAVPRHPAWAAVTPPRVLLSELEAELTTSELEEGIQIQLEGTCPS